MAASPTDAGSNSARERVRFKLNEEKVKLWLPPFTKEDGQKGECPSEMIERYSSQLDLSLDTVMAVLEELRLHALKKLAAEKRFRETGIAVLRIKYAGQVPGRLLSLIGTALEQSVDTSLTVHGIDLKRRVSEAGNVAIDCIKLIAHGSVVKDEPTLEQQHIRHNSQVLALCLSAGEADEIRNQEQAARVGRAREAAEFLSSRQQGDEYYMQIENQSGKSLDLPDAEKKALTLAMVLHEKGRKALKRRDYGEALVFLLEADGEFRKCRAEILTAVDNYALVCLDVVWCYWCLQNISALPDAEVRLKTCEECFHRSYGPNLERLTVVKGNTSEERALLLRLRLLQGILAFLQCRYNDARRLFEQSENELNRLKINDSSMMQVMEMGFTESEARLGLRSCEGNVPRAIQHIWQRREEKKEQRAQDKLESKKKRLAAKLGKTADGQQVNVEQFNTLISMGFPKGASAEALRQSNNDITLAFQIMHEKPELLSLPDPDPPPLTEISEEILAKFAEMGFEAEIARAALHHYGADVERAVEMLLSNGGVVPAEWLQQLQQSLSSSAANSLQSSAAMSTTSSSTSFDAQEKERQRELFEEIIADMPQDENDYLDISLDDEEALLADYKARLLSMNL